MLEKFLRCLAGPVLAGAFIQSPSIAAPDPAAEIRAALEQWTAAFNRRDPAAICGLFAPDLRYDFRGLPEQNFRDICGRLERALADPATRRHYIPDIKEILVSGELAVVRLTWHVTTSRSGRPEVDTAETGMDIFRREPDGSWKIIRYLAYEEPPTR
jgi:steroid delta-isomerase